jgi:hypothetical protein
MGERSCERSDTTGLVVGEGEGDGGNRGGGGQAHPITVHGRDKGLLGLGQAAGFQIPQGGAGRAMEEGEGRDGVGGVAGAADRDNGKGPN